MTTPRSRRSSNNRSTQSAFNQPPWRSSSLSNKNLPISSLSIIVAEPEQGAPLKSASESVASYGENEESETSSVNNTSLSSSTRSKGKRSMIPESTRPDSEQPPSTSPVPSTSSLPPHSSRAISDRSPPLPIPAAQRSKLSSCSSSAEASPPPFGSIVPNTPPSYFGSPKGSPIETPTRPSLPPTKSILTISSLPSSLDDSVPLLPPTPPAHKPTCIPKPTATSALNPTSSRFTLSIPLLGKAKLPLDSVLGLRDGKRKDEVLRSKPPSNRDHARDSQTQVLDLSTALTASSTQPISHSDATAAHDIENNSETIITRNPPTMTSDTAHLDHHNESSSWWNYVGWTTTTTTSTLTSSTTKAVVASIQQTSAANGSQELKPTTPATVLVPAENMNADSASTTMGSDSDESELVQKKGVEEKSNKPVEKKDGDRPLPISSWYLPWGSYSFANTSEPAPLDSEGRAANTVSGADVSTPVPPDLRPETTSVPSPETPEGEREGDAPPAPPHNPITSSMEANWSGWASFFTSRTLMVKRLGYDGSGGVQDVKRDEDGMEVMDLDDDNEQRDVLSKDSGHGVSGHEQHPSSSTTVMPNAIAKTQTSQIELQISYTAGNKGERTGPKSSAKSSVSSTPKTENSRSNTPVPVPALLSLPPSSRDGNQGQSSPNIPTTSKRNDGTRSASPAPSKKSISSPSHLPNLVLPTWEHTFHAPPRNVVQKRQRHLEDQTVGGKLLGKTMKFVSGVFTRNARDESPVSDGQMKGKERAMDDDSNISKEFKKWKEERFKDFGKELPKALQIEEAGLDTDTTSVTIMSHVPIFGSSSHESTKKSDIHLTNKGSQVGDVDEDHGAASHSDWVKDALRGCKRIVIIGIHGWFPGAMLRTVVGEPTGTSTKLANMTEQALQQFEDEHGVKLEKVTKIPLEGDGTIDKRVERLYSALTANESWMSDLHEADAIIVSTHSQGSIVSTHLLTQLIRDSHITTVRNHHLATSFGTGAETFPSAIGVPGAISKGKRKVQRVCCVALCGIHLGPLRYLSSSTLVQPYIQYFESIAARELFEFQNTESVVSKAYVKSLQNVLDHGIKMLYVASLNDQVVPIYSGLFTAASHPLILRALYIDGDAYHSSDFVSNLLVMLIRILNSGISDSGLIAHLSEATAGSLIGVGHSSAYEESATFSLAVKYLFLANDGMAESTELCIEPFNANQEQNDYEIPWSLRDIIADERVSHFFSRDIVELRDAFREWHPKTSILRDLKRKLQPITRLPSSTTINYSSSGISTL